MRLKTEVDTLEKSDHMLHMTHITDFQSLKGVHRQFVLGQERFDQKVQIVVDLEKSYQ